MSLNKAIRAATPQTYKQTMSNDGLAQSHEATK